MQPQKVFTPGEVRSYGLEIGSTHTEPEEKDVAPSVKSAPEEDDALTPLETLTETSDDDLDLDADSETEEHNIDEEVESKADGETSSEKKSRIAAEKQMREFQSRYDAEKSRNDSMQAQFNQLVQEFQKLQQGEKRTELPEVESDLGSEISEDTLLDVKTFKKLREQEARLEQKQRDEEINRRRSQEQVQWVNQQPHHKQVQEYITQKNLAQDSSITSLPTDTIVMYNAIRVKMLEEENANLLKKLKKPISNVPPVGGSRAKVTEFQSNLSKLEKQLFAHARKRGEELRIKTR